MLNTPNNQPEETLSAQPTLTEKVGKAISSSKTLIAAAIALASVTGCKTEKPEASAKPVATLENPSVVTPYTGAEEKPVAPKMSSKEYMARWCEESKAGYPNEQGYNEQIIITSNGTVIEACADGGPKEVPSLVVPCNGKNDIYVPTTDTRHEGQTVAYYYAGATNDTDRPGATVKEKIANQENGVPTLQYRTKRGKTAVIPADAIIVDSVLVDKAVCSGQATGGTRVARTETAVAPSADGEKVQNTRITKLEERADAADAAIKAHGADIVVLQQATAAFNDTHGVCVGYATTPVECENLERSLAAQKAAEEQAKKH